MIVKQHLLEGIFWELWTGILCLFRGEMFYYAPKYLRKSERQLKKLQRIVSRRKKGSNRHKKAVALLVKKHEYIANQRRNNAHKVSRQLINHYDLIAFEDLKITNMMKNHHLAKSIVDSGWNNLYSSPHTRLKVLVSVLCSLIHKTQVNNAQTVVKP